MPIFFSTPSIVHLEETAKQIEKVSTELTEIRKKLHETLVLMRVKVNTATKLATFLAGSGIASRSVIDILNARTLSARIFFFLSCICGTTGAGLSGQALYNSCAGLTNSMVADTLALSFYSAEKYSENLAPADQFSYTPQPTNTIVLRGGNLEKFDFKAMKREIDAQFASGQGGNNFTINLPTKKYYSSNS